MKITLLPILFLFFNFGIMTSSSSQSLKVMSYNIRLDFEGDGVDNWHQRKADLADYILKQSPDFVGVQEALFHQVAFLEGALKNYKYIGVGRDDGERAGEFMAVFYKTDQWTLEMDSTFWLSKTPAVPSMGWDAQCFRVCTFGVFKNEKGNSIALFNTHFDHAGKMARKESVGVLKSYIDNFKNKYPTILIGDFNVEPSDRVYQALSDLMADSRSETSAVHESATGTFNGFNLSDPFERRIDYAFVDNKKIKVKKYKADTPLTKQGRQVSDHFPVIVDLEINTQSPDLTIKGSAKVEALLAEMTIEEKIGQLNLLTPGGAVTGAVVSTDVEQKIKDGKAGGIFGIRGAEKVRRVQEIAVNQSRLGIPLLVGLDVIHGHQTIFPIPLGLSCTWDMDLIEKSARLAAREATADGIMWNFSPMVDISRDPRWGRISEGGGEDPFLGSLIAKAMVKGYQGSDFKDPTTMLACVKHFALYGAAEGGRDYATVDMSKLRMYNEYLPPYKAAVESGVASVMTSFNTVDYIPASGSAFLFEELLRQQWGFEGFVVTDYSTIYEMTAHGLGDMQEVSRLALKAGVDMDMVDEGFLNTLSKSIAEGKITATEIENACRRILMAKEKLGLFEDPFRYCDEVRAKKEILSPENRAFARQAAGASFVLLKNDKNILPLNKKGKIAIIGPLADSRRNMLGTWSVSGDHDIAVTVLEGIKNVAGSQAEILYAKGANISDDPVFAKRVNAFGEEISIDKRTPEVMIAEALEIAKQSDVIVAVMGEAADMSGESSSMADIGLQPSQKSLLEALKKTGKPIVMILYNGRPMTLTWEAVNIDAILDVWFGGTEGGNAVADALFGDVNPGGKLTTSFPVHVGQIPVYHSMLNSGRPDQGNGSKFQSNYLDIPNQPLFPFGFGLSYTTFDYGKINLSKTSFSGDDSITASVTVTNTGKREGAEVVQLYIRDVVGSISRPMKELKGFQKIILQPGESKIVSFTIDKNLLKFYNSQLEFVAEPGQFELFIGTNSEEVQQVSFELK